MGKIGFCLNCRVFISLHQHPCKDCNEIDNDFCWKCHNMKHRYNTKLKYLGKDYYKAGELY